jgi:hypothetical protein
MRISQQEFLHFFNVYSKYIRHSVIHSVRNTFDVLNLLKDGVDSLIMGHDQYLDKMLDEMFLTHKVNLSANFLGSKLI